MDTYNWYVQLIKPTWAPSSSVFGIVWPILYAIIAVSYGTVFYKALTKQIPRAVALPFALNLVFNLAFTTIQFGLQSNLLAAVDILLVLATLVWALFAVYPHAKWIAYANIPYFLWVLFATVLQLTITFLNF